MHLSTHIKTMPGLLFLWMVIAFTPVAAQSINTSGMSFELRRAVENFPVTLYTASSCNPCDAGKALLTARGVPFIEKTIDTQADINALKARNLGDQLPVLSVGSRTVKGYEAGQWEAALNFASYPKSSQLPRGYSNPAATPMVAPAVQAPASAPAPAPNATPAPRRTPTPAAPANDSSNPAGIRF